MAVNQNEKITKGDLIGIDTITLRIPIYDVKFSKNCKDQLEIYSDNLFLTRDEEYLYINFKMNSFSIPYLIPGNKHFDKRNFRKLIRNELKSIGVTLLEKLDHLEVTNIVLVKKIYLEGEFQEYEHLIKLLKLPGYRRSYISLNNCYRFDGRDYRIEISPRHELREMGSDSTFSNGFDSEENALLVWVELKNEESITDIFMLPSVAFCEFDKNSVSNIINSFLKKFLPCVEKYDVDYSVSIFLETNLNLIKAYRYPVFNEHLKRAKNLIKLEDDVTPYATEGKYEGMVSSALVEIIKQFQKVISVPHSYGLEDFQSKQKLGDWVLDDRLGKLKELKSKLMEPAEEINLFAHPLI